jgi:uncharacterized protein YgbK (DUF1537 family)
VSTASPQLLVLADDRTGALETAGACADAGLVAVMTPFGAVDELPLHDCRVVDLGSRQLRAAEAARRAVAAEGAAIRHAHKIDSTLKGNWAVELAARAWPTLLVPAFPAAGRTCVDGVVHVGGRPFGRPADQLDAAGADDVIVADASTDADVDREIRRWVDDPQLLLAGTAGVIGAAARTISGATTPAVLSRVSGRVLVVCGSRAPMSRAQVDAVAHRHDIVVAPQQLTDASTVLRTLHDVVAARLDAVAVLVIVGGDTAAAVLGERVMVVGGTIEPGVAWSRFARGNGPLVLTKPGSFGDEQTLVRVLDAILAP